MEKLIELLNEYELGEDYGDMGEYYYIDTLGNIVDDGGYILKPCEIISKKFGFIKWLVENDKIDLFSRNALFIYEDTENGEKQRPYSFYEEMLIRLAISDTPIEDLLLYLK